MSPLDDGWILGDNSAGGGGAPTGPAGGDLGGTYPNPTVVTVLGGAVPAVLEGSVTSYGGNHAIAASEGFLEFTGAAASTFTLPAPTLTPGQAGSAGRQYAIANTGTALLTVATAGGVVSGNAKIGVGRSALYITDGVNWIELPFTYPLSVVSRATQTVNNSAVLVNDAELLLPLLSNKSYVFHAIIVTESVHGNDVAVSFTAPAGATGGWSPTAVSGNVAVNPSAASTQALKAFGVSATFGGGGAGVPNIAHLIGYVATAGTAGSLQFQFAQGVAAANNCIRYAGSYLALLEGT